MPSTRRLAAILAADVAGYSRLMGEDEEGTLAALKAIRRELSDPKIKEHRGRIVKTTGDGVLVEFASVVDAVRCAVDIQREMAVRHAGTPDAKRIELRIGINLGDIIIDGRDIFGDGVNVAARLEALAEPGGICVSRVVRDQVRDKLDFAFEDRGEQQVKNIARPVRVFDVRTAVERPPWTGLPAAPPLPLPEKPSIAVLPFQNLSGDVEQEYFADGVVEDIITALSRNRAFFVISRNTTFTYKGPAVDVARVARELGVRYVLEGSVRRAGNRVRITVQLIDGATGRHLWADRYDRELADVFAVQDEIAQTITGEMAPGIIAAEMQQARRKDPTQLDAWDRTMRAHWHIRRFTREDMAEARRLLEEAIELDPANAMAMADVSIAYHFEACFGWDENVAQTYGRCGEAARRAVAIDDGDANAQSALAMYDLFQGRHEEARRRLRRAVDLDPNSAFARGYLGVCYAFAGDYEAALPTLDEAVRLSPRDPLLVIWHLCKGWAALLSERYQEAVEFATDAVEANPEFPDVHAVLAAAHGHLGHAAAAGEALAGFLRRTPALTAADERLNRPFGTAAQRSAFLKTCAKPGYPNNNSKPPNRDGSPSRWQGPLGGKANDRFATGSETASLGGRNGVVEAVRGTGIGRRFRGSEAVLLPAGYLAVQTTQISTTANPYGPRIPDLSTRNGKAETCWKPGIAPEAKPAERRRFPSFASTRSDGASPSKLLLVTRASDAEPEA